MLDIVSGIQQTTVGAEEHDKTYIKLCRSPMGCGVKEFVAGTINTSGDRRCCVNCWQSTFYVHLAQGKVLRKISKAHEVRGDLILGNTHIKQIGRDFGIENF